MDFSDFSALHHCMQLRDAHIELAVSSSGGMEALLARFSQIAEPGKGVPTILAALARMGTTACEWIDGGDSRSNPGGDAEAVT